MSVSRNFLLIGSLYLIVGILLGFYMSAAEQFGLATVHAHINLLGFAAMTIFGLAYRLIPALAENWLAVAHFWLHQIGALVFVVFLYLLLSKTLAGPVAGPILTLGEVAIFLGALAWFANLWRHLGSSSEASP